MGNAYLEKQAFIKQSYFDVGIQLGFQRAIDMITIALNDPDCLGSRALGAEAIDRVLRRAVEADEYYGDAFLNRPETDYKRDKLDEKLRQINGPDFPGFEVRHPFCKVQTYGGKRR